MAANGPAPTDLAAALLCVESLAARLEAHTTADPVLGRLWRAEAALTEAVRSVALEDVQVREGDLVAKLAENRVTGPEGQGIAAAHDVLRVLHAPGDLAQRPAETLARLKRAAPGGAAGRAQEGEESAGAGGVEDGQGAGPDAQRIERIATDLATGPGTVLPALRVAGRLAAAVPRQPLVERLAFIAADHALRRAAAARPQIPTRGCARPDEDPLAEIGASGRGAWVLLPATALSADGFRAWAPTHRQGRRDLLDGLGIALGRELGRLGALRHWTDVAVPRFADGPRRRGRRALVAHLMRQPLLTAPMVAEALGVTGQTARNLVAAAETAGVLAQVTRRDRHRVWATPGLAARFAARTPGRRGLDAAAKAEADNRGDAARNAGLAPLEVGVDRPRRDAGLDPLMDEIGAALANLDTVMARPKR